MWSPLPFPLYTIGEPAYGSSTINILVLASNCPHLRPSMAQVVPRRALALYRRLSASFYLAKVPTLIPHSETHAKPSNFVTENTPSTSQASMSREKVGSYMRSTSGGGDLAAALSQGPSPSTGTTGRQAKTQRETDALIAIINRTQ
ncbi:hypothetical protein PG999_003131 [Apiospora kogelbergensis]|uniref:Uncharacterized protein n=1 Tax=Apiospora kogelbergensis TaxID=1337665 RepID=A0AAW0RAD3_9PEZI